MDNPPESSKYLDRRTFLSFTASASIATLMGCKKQQVAVAEEVINHTEDEFWIGNGIGFGTEISAEIWGVSPQEGERLMLKIQRTISHLEQVMSLYLENSELRILNRERQLNNPSPTFVDILTKAKQLNRSTLGYTQPAIHHIWLIIQKKLDSLTSDQSPKQLDWSHIQTLTDHWEAASLDHLTISNKSIKLTHPLTQISLNAIGQGYAADIIAKLLEKDGIRSAKIDCGETYCIGNHPEGRPWKLGVVGKGDLLGYIELANAGLAVSSSAPDKILLDPIAKNVTASHTTAGITSTAGACTADAFATAFATAPKKMHKQLLYALKATGKSHAKLW